MFRILMTGLSLMVTAASATEHEAEKYGHVLELCYAEMTVAEDGDPYVCIGKMATYCMDDQEGGHSTFGMSSCLIGESKVWDAILNRNYQETLVAFEAMDADERINFPEHANRVEYLRQAQRAWIPFRDGECALAYAMWGAGSMRSIAGADCLNRMTAERAIELLRLGDEMR